MTDKSKKGSHKVIQFTVYFFIHWAICTWVYT